MRNSLSCHLKSISGLLIVIFIFATLPVCRVASLASATISEYELIFFRSASGNFTPIVSMLSLSFSGCIRNYPYH